MASTPEVIHLLESYLTTAKNGEFQSVAIAMVGRPNLAAADFAGEFAMEPACKEVAKFLVKRMELSIDNWTLPPRDENLDASHHCYSVVNGPLGFDFLVWLVDAEMIRLREGAPGPLKIGLWCGADPQVTLNREYRAHWRNAVFRPALALIGAVEDDAAVYGWRNENYTSRDICAGARRGERVPLFKARRPRRVPPGTVTITLREADHWPHRNSNFEAWHRFACRLRDEGRHVIFVRDTAKAREEIEGFATDQLASTDLDARMALYERADANLFVSNGPATLAIFSDRPWMQLIPLENEENPAYSPNTRKFWKDHMGVEVGSQYPWATPQQRLVWCTDSYDNIVEAWESLNVAAPAHLRIASA